MEIAMRVRKITAADQAEWLRMLDALWPGDMDEHQQETALFFGPGSPHITEAFVLERDNDRLAGFLQLNLRPYAEGCTDSPVPHIEGWYVDADVRGQGYGGQLVQAAEQWALVNGFHEVTSDTWLDNEASINAHLALGFEEAERIVCFVKPLVGPAS
jgi:aminoglycoside 6'-N-acetyltransferase I